MLHFWDSAVTIMTYLTYLIPSRYKKTPVELYEVCARGQMRSLRSSQISTHLGVDGRRWSPAPAAAARRQQSAAAQPALPGQGPSVVSVQEQQDRYSLLDHQTAEDLNV